MLFGGSFEAAYIMTIFALPSQLMPTTNKRNTALVQIHMEEALGVPPVRGLLRFIALGEDNMALNGKTMAGEIDELERSYHSPPAPTPAATRAHEDEKSVTKRSRARKKLSVKVRDLTPENGRRVSGHS